MKHADCSNILLLTIALLCYSCQPDTTCREDLTVGVIGELQETYYDQNDQPQLHTVWDTITVQGIGAPDTLYNHATNIKKIVLPLHAAQDSTQYTLTYLYSTDTVTLHHTNQQEFISVECGCVYNHDLLSVTSTHHWIEDIQIVSTDISRQKETNIYILRNR